MKKLSRIMILIQVALAICIFLGFFIHPAYATSTPTIDAFQTTSPQYPGTYYLLNETIQNLDGNKTFVNATLAIQSITFIWVNSTNTFSIFSQSGSFATLGTCYRIVVNSTSYKLCWGVTWTNNGQWVFGYKDIQSGTKVFVVSGASVSATQSSWFIWQPHASLYTGSSGSSTYNANYAFGWDNSSLYIVYDRSNINAWVVHASCSLSISSAPVNSTPSGTTYAQKNIIYIWGANTYSYGWNPNPTYKVQKATNDIGANTTTLNTIINGLLSWNPNLATVTVYSGPIELHSNFNVLGVGQGWNATYKSVKQLNLTAGVYTFTELNSTYPSLGWTFGYWSSLGNLVTVNQRMTIQINSTTVFTMTYTYASTSPKPNPTYPYSINTDPGWQFIYGWDFVGFIIYCWTASLGESAFVLWAMAIVGAIYIRTRNLSAMVAMWFLLGSTFIIFIPAASPLIYLLFVFGIAGVMYKVFQWSS